MVRRSPRLMSVNPPVNIHNPNKEKQVAIMSINDGAFLKTTSENIGTKTMKSPVINPEFDAVVKVNPIVWEIYSKHERNPNSNP